VIDIIDGWRHTALGVSGHLLDVKDPMESRTRRRVSRRRKKGIIPLRHLHTSDVVRTVVDHPRRLGELLSMLEDADRSIRGRAAVTIARLSESHPSRLLRILERLREGLADESAYVRWHLACALGEIADRYPGKTLSCCFAKLADCMEDEHRIVRLFALRAVERIASRKSQLIRAHFIQRKQEIPANLAKILNMTEH
jgi:hypothetical protein